MAFQKFTVASTKEHSSGDKITLVMLENRAYSWSKYVCNTDKYIRNDLEFFWSFFWYRSDPIYLGFKNNI